MKPSKPIELSLSIADTVLLKSGLRYLIKDKDRHEIDRELASGLIDKIDIALRDNAIELEDLSKGGE